MLEILEAQSHKHQGMNLTNFHNRIVKESQMLSYKNEKCTKVR